MADLDTFTQNIAGVTDLVESGTNKVNQSGGFEPEGVVGESLDVLDLPMKDEELLALRNEWEVSYASYESNQKEIAKRNRRSYLGRNMKNGALLDDDLPGPANLQFEAEETFLPAALGENPDPVVFADNTPEGNKIAGDVKTMLQFHSKQLLLKRILQQMIRQWSIHHLAVIKPGWKSVINHQQEDVGDVCVENRKIQDFILDPNGYVDVYGDFSSWLGERINSTAKELIDLYPEHKEYITGIVQGSENLGTEVVRTEWWNDEYCFVTFKERVLEKHKNQYFNYPEAQKDMDGQPVLDILGKPQTTQKRNHFSQPKKPYIFLSVFSLQEQPHDITGLIEQNIANQNKISKRTDQIDVNISKSNNSELYSENNFNQETAKQAANAIKDPSKGQILVPSGGPISDAIVRLPALSFPDAGFKDLENSESSVRSSWGIQGIASQEQKPDETARGMILNQGRDTSRIGGGVTDIVEQSVAKAVFDWLVQEYCVFYDVKHFGAVMGVGKAVEYVELSSADINRQLVIGVVPNSMAPKDETSQMNQATSLFQMGAIGPKTLLETLNFPNAEEAAGDGVLWKIDPMSYLKLNFPELYQQVAQMQQEQMQAQVQAQQAEQQNAQAQAGQELGQKEQAHQQKIRHTEEFHTQKVGQMKDIASAKLEQTKLPK